MLKRSARLDLAQDPEYLRGFWEIWVLETQFVCPQLTLDSSPLLQYLEVPQLPPPFTVSVLVSLSQRFLF